jgi:hypothetical protein
MEMLARNETLERGYGGTAKTIGRMHELVQRAKLNPAVQQIATWIRLSAGGDRRGSTRATADAVFDWVKRHGVFQRDPFQVEKLEDLLASAKPVITARQQNLYSGPGIFAGDCDTFALWVAALGGILGFQYAFETAKVDASRPDEFSHVWSALLVNGQWVAYDASTASSSAGWRPPVPPEKFKRWSERNIDEVPGMNGLNGTLIQRDYWESTSEPYSSVPGYSREVSAGDMDLLVPGQPALSQSDILRRPGDNTQPRIPPRPEERDFMNDDNLDPPTYPRPTYEPRKPYIHARQPSPPDSPYVRQVEIVYAPEGGDLISGMGQMGPGIMLAAQAAANQTTQDQAQSSVFSVISSAITEAAKILPQYTQAQIDKKQAEYAERVASARERAAAAEGRPQVNLPPPTPSKSILSSPLLWGAAGIVVIGGIAYAVSKG